MILSLGEPGCLEDLATLLAGCADLSLTTVQLVTGDRAEVAILDGHDGKDDVDANIPMLQGGTTVLRRAYAVFYGPKSIKPKERLRLQNMDSDPKRNDGTTVKLRPHRGVGRVSAVPTTTRGGSSAWSSERAKWSRGCSGCWSSGSISRGERRSRRTWPGTQAWQGPRA